AVGWLASPPDSLRWECPVHQPDPLHLPVLLLNLLADVTQRGVVRRVARQHLVADRIALRRQHHRQDHLHTIRTLVPTVSKAAFVLRVPGRVALEITAG